MLFQLAVFAESYIWAWNIKMIFSIMESKLKIMTLLLRVISILNATFNTRLAWRRKRMEIWKKFLDYSRHVLWHKCDVLSQNIKWFMDSEVKLWLNWQYIFNVVLALKVMNEIEMKTLLWKYFCPSLLVAFRIVWQGQNVSRRNPKCTWRPSTSYIATSFLLN